MTIYISFQSFLFASYSLTMETSTLAVESFSYSWLINAKPSLDDLGSPPRTSLDISDESASMGKDYHVLKSQSLEDEAQTFNFDVPISQSSAALIHADEVFSDGFIVPMFVDPAKEQVLDTSHSLSSVPLSSLPSRPGIPSVGIHFGFFRKWQKSSTSALYRCFGCFRPFHRKLGGSRKSIRVDDIDRRLWETRSWRGSPQPSLHQSDWCHMESSIHEAVLYCKRSIGILILSLFSERYLN